ncbi:MAG: SgcJ/EcaC family oxidoreductase [Deltaproteobacteria bacterium]|nr:SgcJ/EcaC family oxidoreductase [Deltaproteobacteria bacterium]
MSIRATLGIVGLAGLLALSASAQQPGQPQQPSQQQPGTMQQPPSQQAGQPQAQQPSMQPQAKTTFPNQAPQQVIEKLQARTREYEQAWNNHDIKKMGTFYTTTATYMSTMGQAANGQVEIQKLIQQEQSGPMKNSQVSITLQSVRTITPDIAIMDVEQMLTGVAQPSSGPTLPTNVHVTVVAVRRGNNWFVEALRAFPTPSAPMGVGGAGEQTDTEGTPPPSSPPPQRE